MKSSGTLLTLFLPFFASPHHAASFVGIITDDSSMGLLRQVPADVAAMAGAHEITLAPGLSGQSIAPSVTGRAGSTALAISDADGVTVDVVTLPGGLTLHDREGTGYRVFYVIQGNSLTWQGLTLSGFELPAGGGGGAIANNGMLTQCCLVPIAGERHHFRVEAILP